MEDEKQLVRDLFAKPCSRQSLDDAIAAFNDLSGKDRCLLADEFLSSQLGKDFENLSRQLAQTLEKLGAQTLEKLGPRLEAFGEVDYKKMLVRLIQRIPYGRGRDKKQVKDDGRRLALEPAIIAEATHLDKALTTSMEFARLVRPGVLKRLELPLELPDKAKWPTESTIKRAISRIREQRVGQTNRVTLT
jgi:hypothetical protein